MSLITKSTYLRGPKGNIGLQGPKGERGLQGAPGLPGPAGQPDPQFIRNQISATGNITYNQATGAIGFTNPGYATTTYVDTAIANLVSGAPDLLNTLNELAAAIGNNANFINSVIVKTGGTMTGALILNANPTTNLGAATKQYVDAATSNIVTDYNDLTNKPTLFSGSYTDLTNKPAPTQTDRLVNGSKEVVLQSNGYIRLVNGAQLYDYGSGTGNGYGITDAANGTYIGYDPIDTLGALHMDSYTGGNIRIRTTTLPNTYNDWLYSSDGVLSIPTGGDIKRNGVSVLNSFSGSYTDLTNKPTLFSGSYNDLTNKPTIPLDINQLSDTSNLLSSYVLPTASTGTLGGVKVDGTTISIDSLGIISSVGGGSGASNWSDVSVDGGSDFESIGSDPDNYGSSELVIDGGEFIVSGNYTPGDATSWASPAPTTIDQALDRLAAKIAYLSDQGYTQKP